MPAQIFGRDAELQAIGAFLGALPDAPGALVLAGDAGAGKTILLRAGAALAAERGFTVLETMPARGDLRLAFAGLADLLEPHLETVIGDLPSPQARALRVALLLQEAPAHPPDPRIIAAAFRAALGILARSAPVLVVIDDVQWLDPASEAVVGFAVRRLDHEAAGLLCAQRTAQPGAGLPLELERARLHAELLPVGGLSLGALHRLLRARLGTSFAHPTLRRVQAESGGNPFIALEIGRALARRGITSVGNAALPVPDTLSGLVDERLAALSPAVLDALRLVTVMPGAPFGQYLGAGAGGAELDAAVLAGVLEPDDGRLRFTHPLLAAAVAGSIPPARRRELHALAAGTVARPEERARHRAYAAAGPSAPVAAELVEAGRAAAGRGAPATAAELFELAASLTPPEQPDAALLRRLEAARQLALAGETRGARMALEQLVASMPPGPQRADALSQLSLLREDDFGAALALQDQALAEAADDLMRTADIHMKLSDIALGLGDHERALDEARQALADAERTDDLALLAAALAQAYCYAFVVGAPADERQLERALELERDLGAAPLRTQPSFVAGYCHMTQGRLEEAEAELEYVLARAEASGAEYARADALLRLSLVAARHADAGLAADRAAAGLEIAEQLDQPQLISALLYGSARAALQAGLPEVVRELARRGEELARRSGDRPYVISHQALLGSLELALGDYSAAAALFRPLVSQSREMGARLFATQGIASDVIETLAAVGEIEAAAALLAEAEPFMQDPPTAALAARCRGALAAGRGETEAALTELTAALRLHDQASPQPLERARTLLMRGMLQRRLRQRAAARASLTEATAVFEEIKAPLWAARAQAELVRISGRAPGPRELTVTEQRVAELVARGMSNREVAAELFVSVRAVESTLTKTYAKLGLRSRAELLTRWHRLD